MKVFLPQIGKALSAYGLTLTQIEQYYISRAPYANFEDMLSPSGDPQGSSSTIIKKMEMDGK